MEHRKNFLFIRNGIIKLQRIVKKNKLVCPICIEYKPNIVKPYVCSHRICEDCYLEWNQRGNNCPTCRSNLIDRSRNISPLTETRRSNVNRYQIPRIRLIDNINNNLYDNNTNNNLNNRNEIDNIINNAINYHNNLITPEETLDRMIYNALENILERNYNNLSYNLNNLGISEDNYYPYVRNNIISII